ncbi:MAG: hypothetical protein LBI81_03070 [Puniceicoccales bacterium]|jgi:hypothetical protein|nr:hypothetical protein [Puniceicoccales bacterium]
MIFGDGKFLILALVAPASTALLLFYGARKSIGKFKILFDSSTDSVILPNFHPIVRRTKSILCVIIPALYAFILAETSIGDGLTAKIDISRHLTLIAIMFLLSERLISAGKRNDE